VVEIDDAEADIVPKESQDVYQFEEEEEDSAGRKPFYRPGTPAPHRRYTSEDEDEEMEMEVTETKEEFQEPDPLSEFEADTTMPETVTTIEITESESVFSLRDALGGDRTSEEEDNAMEEEDEYLAPLVLTQGVDRSLDYCPQCETELDPIRGRYSLNVVTSEVTLTCVDCRRIIVIRDAFSEKVRNSIQV